MPGGRAGLSRIAAVVGDVYTVGRLALPLDLVSSTCSQSYQIPDYTAYDQMLSYVLLFPSEELRLLMSFVQGLQSVSSFATSKGNTLTP